MPSGQGTRVLVVDDDPKLLAFVLQGLRESELEPEGAGDIGRARALLAERRFDLVLLDVMLASADGRDLLAELRNAGDDVPVILVTARDATEERIEGLRLGADDYVVKPFAFAELVARIQAVMRRRRGAISYGFGDLTIAPATRRAKCGDREIELSPREFDVLSAFVRARGDVLTRERLLSSVWGIEHDPGTNVVDVVVGRVRRKLQQSGGPRLATVRGEGYRLEEAK